MKKYKVIEDNGGGITLVVFDQDGNVEYLHTGYEYVKKERLLVDLQALKDGDDPAEEWEGNVEEPQAIYDQITSYEYGWEMIADNDGVYSDKMGAEGKSQFGVSL